MWRLITASVVGVCVLASACGDGSDTPASVRRPTITPAPTATPLDPNLGCGPPLPESYCARDYRQPPPSCRVSGVWNISRINANLLDGIGEPPVWMASTSPTATLLGPIDPAPETGVKTLWVVDYRVEGNVRLTGRRLDGPGVAVFPSYERDPNFYEDRRAGTWKRQWDRTELVLVPPHGLEHRTEIYIPSPDCWQFTAVTEQETVEIIWYLFPPDPPEPSTTPPATRD